MRTNAPPREDWGCSPPELRDRNFGVIMQTLYIFDYGKLLLFQGMRHGKSCICASKADEKHGEHCMLRSRITIIFSACSHARVYLIGGASHWVVTAHQCRVLYLSTSACYVSAVDL